MKKGYTRQYFEQRDLLIPHMANVIKSLAKSKKLIKVLDVGCGTGRLVKFLNDSGFKAIGCDSSEKAVEKAKKLNKKGIIIKASASRLPFGKNSFDLITAISVIEHLKKSESENFFKEARRTLKPEGFIFLVTPNFATPLRIIQGKNWFAYKDPTHINFFTPGKLFKMLKRYGFFDPKFLFKIDYDKSLNWEFPSFFLKLPKLTKKILIYLLFSTPLSLIRNSFWIAAQKDD